MWIFGGLGIGNGKDIILLKIISNGDLIYCRVFE